MLKITDDGIFNFFADGTKKEIKFHKRDYPVTLPMCYSSSLDCMCDLAKLENLGYSGRIDKHFVWKDYVIILTGKE